MNPTDREMPTVDGVGEQPISCLIDPTIAIDFCERHRGVRSAAIIKSLMLPLSALGDSISDHFRRFSFPDLKRFIGHTRNIHG